MGYCPDCGGRTSSGICSNCQEELHILTFQDDCLDPDDISPEFMSKAGEQEKVVDKRMREKVRRQIRAGVG